MKRIINKRRCILVLPQSKLILEPGGSVAVEELNDELQKAVSKGWVKLGNISSKTQETSSQDADSEESNSKVPLHDWEVDYSRIEENLVTITDKISGKSIIGEIQDKKGNQYFTLKDIGTVKKQQFWPTLQAMEQFNDAE